MKRRVYALAPPFASDNTQPRPRLATLGPTKTTGLTQTLGSTKIHYHSAGSVPVEVREQLTLAVISIENDCLTYDWVSDCFSRLGYRKIPVSARPLPSLRAVHYTNLKALILQWDSLPLPWLSDLVRLLRVLEALHIRFSERYTLHDTEISHVSGVNASASR